MNEVTIEKRSEGANAYEVLNVKGEVLARFSKKADANDFCQRRGLSVKRHIHRE